MNPNSLLPSFTTSFLNQQIESIEIDFKKMSSCIIAAPQENLIRLSNNYKWKLLTLPNISQNSAMVIHKEHSGPELWVNAFYRGYRQAFQFFLDQFYSKYNVQIPKNFHVDHLHPVTRFNKTEHNTYFIRLALLYGKTNISYGGGFEKLFYSQERQRKLENNIFMDWFVFLKVNHVDFVKKGRGIDEWKIWSWKVAKMFGKRGFDPVLTYIGITTILNLSYENKWSPLPPHFSFLDEIKKYPSMACCPSLFQSYDF